MSLIRRVNVTSKLSKAEMDTIMAIAVRAGEIVDGTEDPQLQASFNRLHVMMDIATVHYFTPLRLQELLEADGFNFSHDVFGIRRHLDRDTGHLEDCFVPRFAIQQ